MALTILQTQTKTSTCAGACKQCPRRSPLRNCTSHTSCPGYGTSANCPPLIVLAVHEYLNTLLDVPHLKPAHA